MTTAQGITAVVGVLFIVAFLYKLNDVRRDPKNIGAWAVLVILFALMIATTIRDGAPAAFGSYGVDTVGVLLRNIAQVVGFAGLQLWHLRLLPRVSKKRLVEESVILVAVITAMITVTVTLPSGVGLTWSNQNLAHFEVLVFYYVAGGYVIYCLACQLRWNIQFARKFKQRLLKTSAVITAFGDFFLICTQLSRQISQNYNHFVSGQRPRLTTILELSFVAIGMPLLIIGLLLPPIIGMVRSVWDLGKVAARHYALRHLHAAIAWAYPGMIRPLRHEMSTTSRVRDTRLLKPARALRLAYTERLQQCRDGYARSRNTNEQTGRPAALAQTLNSLDVQVSGKDLRNEDAQTTHLLAVSRALGRHGHPRSHHAITN